MAHRSIVARIANSRNYAENYQFASNTARSPLYQSSYQIGLGRTAIIEAAMSKLHISESWIQSCEDALQIHGGYGYMTEYEIERELRDALGSRLYSGTNEIQRNVIASLLL